MMKVVVAGFGRPYLVLCAIATVLLAGACESRQPRTAAVPSQQPEILPSPDRPSGGDALLPLPADAQEAEVVHHTDGDTLALRGYRAGKVLESTSQITVRLLEIDTPETKQPGTPVQCYGPQASAHLAELAPLGAMVYVAADEDRIDPHGRDLLYLWNAAGRSVNLAMVEGGFAKAVLYPPNDRYFTVLRGAEAKAKAGRRGLWGACTPAPVMQPSMKPAPAPITRPAPPRGNCDPAYPLSASHLDHRIWTVTRSTIAGSPCWRRIHMASTPTPTAPAARAAELG